MEAEKKSAGDGSRCWAEIVANRAGGLLAFVMIRISAVALLLGGVISISVGFAQSSDDKTPSTRDFTDLRTQVETMRGKKFTNEVPVFTISKKELRAISDRELDQKYPGPKLRAYEELLTWLDLVPAKTDLKSAYAEFLVDQLAGLYDGDTKEMCIPSFSNTTTNSGKKAA